MIEQVIDILLWIWVILRLSGVIVNMISMIPGKFKRSGRKISVQISRIAGPLFVIVVMCAALFLGQSENPPTITSICAIPVILGTIALETTVMVMTFEEFLERKMGSNSGKYERQIYILGWILSILTIIITILPLYE